MKKVRNNRRLRSTLATIRSPKLYQKSRLVREYPRKGSIGVGFDADAVLWDPKLKKIIRQFDLHGSDYTPWEGFWVTGWPVATIAPGRVVAEKDRR